MKKFKILCIIVVAVVGALIIYNHFDKEEFKSNLPNVISNDYNLTSEIGFGKPKYSMRIKEKEK